MVTRFALIASSTLVAALAGHIPADPARAALPDLPRQAAPGQSFAVPPITRGGPIRYYLSRDSKRSLDDVRLIGPSGRGARAGKAPRVSVPPASPGAYRLLSCAGTRCAASRSVLTVADTVKTQIQAFSDTRDVDDPNLPADARFNPTMCPAPAPPGQLPSTAGALKAAQTLLANAAGPKGMAAFKDSAAYRSADAGESAAVEAVAVGQPGAALAALLRAHDLQPDQPRYLVAAAAILTGLGHPKEALALINSADSLTPTGSAPFGINTQAIALNAKGEALIALGQFADAEQFLRAAIAIEPLLSEAKQNLAVALMCRQHNDEAMRFLRAGSARQATLNPDGSISLPNAEDLLDLGHGTNLSLPPIPIPESFEVAAKSVPLYNALGAARGQRLQDRSRQDVEFAKQLAAHPDNLLTMQRQLDIIKLATPPEFKAEEDRLLKLHSDTHAAVLNIVNGLIQAKLDWNHKASLDCSGIYDGAKAVACRERVYQDACIGPSRDANNKVAELIAAEDRANREYLPRFYTHATAVLANIASPIVHDRWSVIIDGQVDLIWTSPLAALSYWSAWARDEQCGQAVPEPTASSDGPTAPHSEPCPPFVKGVKLSWKFGADKAYGVPFDLALEANCDKVSVEVGGAVEGWVGVFGQVDWSPRSGKMTILAGPKISAKIPGTSIGGSFKDGLYVTFKGDESIGDFGFRTSISGSAGFGPFSIKGGDSMDFSFAPVFGLAK